jgi:hypothetical protein
MEKKTKEADLERVTTELRRSEIKCKAWEGLARGVFLIVKNAARLYAFENESDY